MDRCQMSLYKDAQQDALLRNWTLERGESALCLLVWSETRKTAPVVNKELKQQKLSFTAGKDSKCYVHSEYFFKYNPVIAHPDVYAHEPKCSHQKKSQRFTNTFIINAITSKLQNHCPASELCFTCTRDNILWCIQILR